MKFTTLTIFKCTVLWYKVHYTVVIVIHSRDFFHLTKLSPVQLHVLPSLSPNNCHSTLSP